MQIEQMDKQKENWQNELESLEEKFNIRIVSYKNNIKRLCDKLRV